MARTESFHPLDLALAGPKALVNIFRSFIENLAHNGNAPTDRLPIKLQDKLGEIQNGCSGFHVISTVCGNGGHGYYVRGTRRVSLHCLDKAADFTVRDYSCAYIHLQGWPGGFSTDPKIVGHVHISLGGREDGLRFVHGGHGGSKIAAKARHRHYASTSPRHMTRARVAHNHHQQRSKRRETRV